jgi:exopolyphosphatase / guanosine-5'-triphosphate,3'-diphosphate pyrophosphatase
MRPLGGMPGNTGCNRGAGALTASWQGDQVGANGKSGGKPDKARRRHGWPLRRPPRQKNEGASASAAGHEPLPLPAAVRHAGEQPEAAIYGALDLGTNNCRLLLARPSVAAAGFEVVDAYSRIVRLGEGVLSTGRLSDEAVDRTIKALRVCSNKLKWWNVRRARLIATEACRMASNGGEFISRVKDELGLELEIIDRETEANLAAAGASPLICGEARTVLVFDIGGGSTEILWLNVSNGRYRIGDWTSLPAGVVTVAERFGGKTVNADNFAAMREHVHGLARPFADRLMNGRSAASLPDHLLGTSGTVTTVCGIHLNLRRYDRARVDGSWINGSDVARVTQELLSMSYEERAASPCVGPERADLVLAGCAILEEIRAIWPAERIRVADRGLREGILTSLMMEDGYDGRTA